MLAEAQNSDYSILFCGHRWVENENVAQRARNVCPKDVTVVGYWRGLKKSKQPGQGKPDNNTTYDHLCLSHKGILVPLKIQFFEGIARDLNACLLIFQSDKPMAIFSWSVTAIIFLKVERCSFWDLNAGIVKIKFKQLK